MPRHKQLRHNRPYSPAHSSKPNAAIRAALGLDEKPPKQRRCIAIIADQAAIRADYVAYLKSDWWKHKARTIRRRAAGHCEECHARAHNLQKLPDIPLVSP